jgi:hypothetical protein
MSRPANVGRLFGAEWTLSLQINLLYLLALARMKRWNTHRSSRRNIRHDPDAAVYDH